MKLYVDNKSELEKKVKRKYLYCEVTIGELMASIEVVGLSMEEVYQVYKNLIKRFSCKSATKDILD